MDPAQVMVEVRTGTSYVCAMCDKFWEGKEIRAKTHAKLNIVTEGQLCTAKTGCGSPFAGDVFHEYSGPLNRFDSVCFVCGDKAKFAIRVKNLIRVMGVCEKHRQWFKAWKFEPQFRDKLVPVSADEYEKREIIER